MQHLADLKRKVPLDKGLLTELYVNQRLTIRELSERFGGVGPLSILRTLRKLNIWRPEVNVTNCPPHDIGKVVGMYKSGLTVPEIAPKFPCSESHIYRILRSAGIKPKRKHATRCKIAGCAAPIFLFKSHGVITGTMCKTHFAQYKAQRAKESYRRKHGLKQDASICRESHCSKPRWGRRMRCKLHAQLRAANRQRERYRRENNVPRERWRVLDADSRV